MLARTRDYGDRTSQLRVERPREALFRLDVLNPLTWILEALRLRRFNPDAVVFVWWIWVWAIPYFVMISLLRRRTCRPDPLAVARLWAFNPLRFLELLAPGFLRLPTGQAPKLLYGQELFSSFWADSVYVGTAVAAPEG